MDRYNYEQFLAEQPGAGTSYMNRTPLSDIPGRPMAAQPGMPPAEQPPAFPMTPPPVDAYAPQPVEQPASSGFAPAQPMPLSRPMEGAPSELSALPRPIARDQQGLYGDFNQTYSAGRQQFAPEQAPQDPFDAWMQQHMPRSFAMERKLAEIQAMQQAAGAQPQVEAEMAQQKAQTELALMQQKGELDLTLTRQKTDADMRAQQQKSEMADQQMQQKMRHQQQQQQMQQQALQQRQHLQQQQAQMAPPSPPGGAPMPSY
jgi:hypothetical protein